MVGKLQHLFQEMQIKTHHNEGITVASVTHQEEGYDLAKAILYEIVDKKSVLFLSGGRTPKALYALLAKEEKLEPVAVGMVDERYGKPMHEKSNEKMLKETGILRYLKMRDIPFYSILHHAEGREQCAGNYDQQIRSLLATYQKHIALLGVGTDGHTAGLPAQSSKFKMQNSKLHDDYRLITEYNDISGVYGERITMTFLGLSMMDFLIVLVFGEDKKEALKKMFSDGSEEEIPSRFLKRPEIARKTLLITDQII